MGQRSLPWVLAPHSPATPPHPILPISQSRSKSTTPTSSPTQTPSTSFSPSPTPSPHACDDAIVTAALSGRAGAFSGVFTRDSYVYDELECGPDGEAFGMGTKTVVVSVELGLVEGVDVPFLLDADEAASDFSGGSLTVHTCTPTTQFDTVLFVGTGCPNPTENGWAFGCVASNGQFGSVQPGYH